MISGCVFPPESGAHRALHEAAAQARCVVICGVPGMGKSLLLREQALIAEQHGRTVHRLQWDVARQPFERAEILARYPEIEGSTHPVIRRAAGLWVRRAVASWFDTHREAHLLLIEAPLVGGRFIELARVQEDAAEALLAARTTRFLVPVPAPHVRAAIEAARAQEMAQPRHARDAASALPVVVDALWQAVLDAARELKLSAGSSGYAPELYAAVYAQVLRHRHVTPVAIDEVVSVASSPHALEHPRELTPSDPASLIEEAESAGIDAIARCCEAWYRL